MTYKTGIGLGRISKVSGFEGAVTVKLERIFSGELPHTGPVFLEIEGRPVPFFIEDSDYPGADLIRFKFSGYDTPEAVSRFVGCRVFLTGPGAPAEKDEDLYLLTGFAVISGKGEGMGTITGIIENPAQLLLSITTPGKKELLVPFHEDLILKIDRKKRIIKMEIPDGLTEIN
jgi:16S rRNA processing protein RimM